MIRNTILLALLISLVAACTYTQKIRDGRSAFDRKQYAVAVDLLQKEYDKAKSRVEQGKIAFLLGQSYEEINKSDLSIKWYNIAYNNQYGVDALKAYAFALKRAERYEEAKLAFKDLGIEIGSPYEYRREISACEIAMGWKETPPQYEIEVLPFNTSDADYSPVLYRTNQLVITSDRRSSTGDKDYNWTGNAFSDLFLVDLSSNTVSNFDGVLNTANNEGTASFTGSQTEMYFTRCFGGGKYGEANCKIMYSQLEGSSWSIPEALPFMEEEVNYGHPAVTNDGSRLYFSSDHPEGWGGHDLYYVDRQSDGSWGEPKLMSRVINTPRNEKFPFIDNDTLYFSSNGHTSMGGLDVFRTHQMGDRGWSPVQNLLPPINSGKDDFGYVVDYNATKKDKDILQVGYFTSSREDGIGNDDVYRFVKRVPPPAPPVAEKDIPKPEDYKLLLTIYVLEKIYDVDNDPNSKVLGRKPLPGAKVKIKWGRKNDEVTMNEEGAIQIELDRQTDYDFLASNPGYLTNDAIFSTKGMGQDPDNPVQKFELEIELDKIFFDKEITLENIYYDFDKWNIREDAQPTLNELVRNLSLNPDIRIQLGSHTDCRGNDRYNQDLSQKRAQSAVDYLIAQGIDASRLQALGYGEEEPEVDCICSRCTEEEHQENRRTTFKILE
jgi:peptidoglycan-associated lipoprotein